MAGNQEHQPNLIYAFIYLESRHSKVIDIAGYKERSFYYNFFCDLIKKHKHTHTNTLQAFVFEIQIQ